MLTIFRTKWQSIMAILQSLKLVWWTAAMTDWYVILFRFAERKDSSSAQVESEKEIRTNGNGGPR